MVDPERQPGAQVTVTSASVSGHFGELLQGRIGTSGPVALITLPCPVLAAHATWRPGAFALHQPSAKVLKPRVAHAFLSRLGLRPSGRFTLRLDMPPGGGAGASTAALVALAKAAGVNAAAHITEACHAIERATDPLLFRAPERILWASRLGLALSALPPLPRLDILGGFSGPPQATDPADCAFPDIADLVAEWPAACASATAIARLASQSASRTIALRGPRSDPTADLAARNGALGWSMAHTGSARALIFAPGMEPQAAAADMRRAGFTRIVRFKIGGAV
ncbi:hypothetical protein GALL_468370 [mine drainage metagenome]|uniref:Threonine kinase n=1 Tax=mine drainage metagenome TaxID=410659 RepID=A0A1J5PL50_9ZZZZ